MKKLSQLVGLSAFVLLAMLLWQGRADARIAGTQPSSADIFCVGPSGTEACLDASANFVPTTARSGALGTSSLPWSNVASQAGSFTTLTVASPTVSNILTLSKTAIGSATGAGTGIWISTTIPVTSSYETLISSQGNITITSLPSISTGPTVGVDLEFPTGTFLILSSTSTDSVTLQDAGTLSGSQLQLGAATRAISKYKTLMLIYDATDHFWREIAYGNN